VAVDTIDLVVRAYHRDQNRKIKRTETQNE
jgi:hypothetical protein